jgi:hypothetical protein
MVLIVRVNYDGEDAVRLRTLRSMAITLDNAVLARPSRCELWRNRYTMQ